MGKKANNLITVILLFCIVLTIIYYRRQSFGKRNQIAALPSIHVIDHLGRRIARNELLGANLYVQFIHSLDENNLGLLEKTYSQWRDEGVTFLLFADRTDDLLEKEKALLEVQSPRLHVCANSGEVEKKFRSGGYGKHFIFDVSGRLLFSADNNREYENGVKPYLLKLVRNDAYSLAALLGNKRNISEIPEFEHVVDLAKLYSRDFYIIAMFSSICNNCGTTSIINWLEKVYEKDNRIQVLCILSAKHEIKDIIALRSQLSLTFPIYICDPILNQKWETLIKRYSEQSVNNILILTNREGLILRYYEPKTAGAFRTYVEDEIPRERSGT